MDSNQKRFGIYVFLSTFSRNLIEVFIPIVLYKYGYNIKEIIFYYLTANIISLFLSYPFVYLSQKYNNKVLSIIGIVTFLILQILLNCMNKSIWYLLIIATLFAIYRRGYWIARRYYNLKIIKKKNISTTYSIISIINQIGVIISAYLGSIVLDYLNLNILTIVAICIFTASLIPLYLLEFKNDRANTKLEKAENISPQSVMQTYMLERLLERISLSNYKNNLILKGGMLISSIIGIDSRTTMNMDTTIKGFKWLEIYPDNNKNIAISVCINTKGDFLEWYFDIAKDSALTENGVPYIDDLYLGVILTPEGEIRMIDQEELQEALNNQIISQDDYDLAYKVANELMAKIDGKIEEIDKFTRKYFNILNESL